jgi:hypothetical protein
VRGLFSTRQRERLQCVGNIRNDEQEQIELLSALSHLPEAKEMALHVRAAVPDWSGRHAGLAALDATPVDEARLCCRCGRGCPCSLHTQVSGLKKQVLQDGAAAICAREFARETGDFGVEKVPGCGNQQLGSKSSDGERARLSKRS